MSRREDRHNGTNSGTPLQPFREKNAKGEKSVDSELYNQKGYLIYKSNHLVLPPLVDTVVL